jgi:hypothetical protein
MIYLLHFDRPYKHARHYIGYTDNLEARLQRHRSGQGARLIEVIISVGINFVLARVWQGDRYFERKLHNRKNSKFLCPICKENG